MRKTLIILSILIILTISGCSQIDTTNTNQDNAQLPDPLSSISQEQLANQPTGNATYQNYTPEIQSELNGKQPYAIFFHAPWCPQCVLLDSQITANLKDLPDSVIILKADYDTETKLKAQYDIRIQSTVVYINQDGEVSATIPYTSDFLQVADALIINTLN